MKFLKNFVIILFILSFLLSTVSFAFADPGDNDPGDDGPGDDDQDDDDSSDDDPADNIIIVIDPGSNDPADNIIIVIDPGSNDPADNIIIVIDPGSNDPADNIIIVIDPGSNDPSDDQDPGNDDPADDGDLGDDDSGDDDVTDQDDDDGDDDDEVVVIFPGPIPVPTEPAEPEPTPTNNPPTITDFNFPGTVDLDSDVTVIVTAHDNDGNLNKIEMETPVDTLSQSCIGDSIDCIRSFTFKVTSAFSTIFNLIARVFDTASASDSKTASINVNPTPIPTPTPTPTPPDEKPKEDPVKKQGELLISSLRLENECVAPGQEENFLLANIKNNGNKKLKNVKITSTVQDLGIRSASGPFTIRKSSSASRLLFFDIPTDAEEGIYYIRIAVTSSRDFTVKYRIIEVNEAC